MDNFGIRFKYRIKKITTDRRSVQESGFERILKKHFFFILREVFLDLNNIAEYNT